MLLYCTAHTCTYTQYGWISKPELLAPAQASVHVTEHCHTAGTHSLSHTLETSALLDLSPIHKEVMCPPWGCIKLPVSQLHWKWVVGSREGWLDEHTWGVLKVWVKVERIEIDLRKMKNHEMDVEKMGIDDKWEEAAGRKMEQQTKGQKTRRKQRVLRWGQTEKTPLCARVVPYHTARAKQQSLNILTLNNNITSSDSNCVLWSVSCCLALPL